MSKDFGKGSRQKRKKCVKTSAFPCRFACLPRKQPSGKDTQCRNPLKGQAATAVQWVADQDKRLAETNKKRARAGLGEARLENGYISADKPVTKASDRPTTKLIKTDNHAEIKQILEDGTNGTLEQLQAREKRADKLRDTLLDEIKSIENQHRLFTDSEINWFNKKGFEDISRKIQGTGGVYIYEDGEYKLRGISKAQKGVGYGPRASATKEGPTGTFVIKDLSDNSTRSVYGSDILRNDTPKDVLEDLLNKRQFRRDLLKVSKEIENKIFQLQSEPNSTDELAARRQKEIEVAKKLGKGEKLTPEELKIAEKNIDKFGKNIEKFATENRDNLALRREIKQTVKDAGNEVRKLAEKQAGDKVVNLSDRQAKKDSTRNSDHVPENKTTNIIDKRLEKGDAVTQKAKAALEKYKLIGDEPTKQDEIAPPPKKAEKFFDLGTKLQTGKAIKSLQKEWNDDRYGNIKSHELIEKLISDGAKLEKSTTTNKKGNDQDKTSLWLDGTGTNLTPTEVKYAQHILNGGMPLAQQLKTEAQNKETEYLSKRSAVPTKEQEERNKRIKAEQDNFQQKKKEHYEFIVSATDDEVKKEILKTKQRQIEELKDRNKDPEILDIQLNAVENMYADNKIPELIKAYKKTAQDWLDKNPSQAIASKSSPSKPNDIETLTSEEARLGKELDKILNKYTGRKTPAQQTEIDTAKEAYRAANKALREAKKAQSNTTVQSGKLAKASPSITARYADVRAKTQRELSSAIRDLTGFRPRKGETSEEYERRVRIAAINRQNALKEQIKAIEKKASAVKGRTKEAQAERAKIKEPIANIEQRIKRLDRRINQLISGQIKHSKGLMQFNFVQGLGGQTEKITGRDASQDGNFAGALLLPKTIDAIAVLGFDQRTPTSVGAQKYRQLAKKYHPDNRETGDREKFEELKLAYDHYREVRAHRFKDGKFGGWDNGKYIGENEDSQDFKERQNRIIEFIYHYA